LDERKKRGKNMKSPLEYMRELIRREKFMMDDGEFLTANSIKGKIKTAVEMCEMWKEREEGLTGLILKTGRMAGLGNTLENTFVKELKQAIKEGREKL
jgi:hypothetical protein